MKYFELHFKDQTKKIAVEDDYSFKPHQDFEDMGLLLAINELTEEEFNADQTV